MDKNVFVENFTKEVMSNNAAIFAGAGMSMAVGYVGWNELLEPLAKEIGLDINKETDLVALAQYYYNENHYNRSEINRIIVDEFSKQVSLNENHKTLARLPIDTYWTTNYDKLIETALSQEHKVVDVKYTVKQLSITKTKRDAVVYKMHGDVDHSSDAILIKDDYESYYKNMEPFLTALSGDLVSKTFLFIGFSFTDPNLDYILSRVRTTYKQDQRRHYCLIKQVEKMDDENPADFEYRKRKQQLFINDLGRFNIQTVLLNSYSEITEILHCIERKIKSKNVFLSGSAEEYNNWSKGESETFIHNLSKELIRNDFNIVSGFGLGVGSFVISGALEELYINQGKISDNRLILRPFSQGEKGREQWDQYRKEMLARTGISIFVYGNKTKNEEIVKAEGVRREFEISKEQGNYIVPVGVTGYVAKDLWNEVNENFEEYYPNATKEIRATFKELNNETLSKEEVINKVLCFIKMLSK